MAPIASVLLGNRLPEMNEFIRALAPRERDPLRQELLKGLGDPGAPLLARISAGNALGLLGDPRIDPSKPQMCRVRAGSFEMGTDVAEVETVSRRYGIPESWMWKSTPRHRVEVDSFEIGRFLVTELEYAHFLEATGYHEVPAHWVDGAPSPYRRNHPVFGLDWQAILLYVEWLSESTGLQYRVPTEIEWEYAARGTDRRSFPWGDAFEARRCNTREGGVGDTTPVGVYPDGAAASGALDLAGNVEEYTADLYRPYPGSRFQDPEYGTYRMTRGGTFSLDADLARCDRRHGDGHAAEVGFRLARSVAAGWSE